jgi:hypothetical protein
MSEEGRWQMADGRRKERSVKKAPGQRADGKRGQRADGRWQKEREKF